MTRVNSTGKESGSNFSPDNGTGLAVRTAMKDIFESLRTVNSADGDPSGAANLAAYQLHINTSNAGASTPEALLKIYTGSSFVTLGNVLETNFGFLSASGGTMTGALLADDAGTASAPAISFDGDTDLGLFRKSANVLGFSANGTEHLFLDQNGITLNLQNEVRFGDSDSSNYVGIKAPSTVASNKTITLPDETGTLLTSGSSIANSNLANSSVTVGSTAINLGDTQTTIAGLTSLTSTTVVAGTVKSSNTEAPLFKNSSNVEKGRLIEAYCSFVGTGTVTKGESFNVSSITDNGTGDFTFNFTNDFDSVDYCTVGSQAGSGTHPFVGGSESERLVGSCRMLYGTSGGSGAGGFQNDPSRACFIAIGG